MIASIFFLIGGGMFLFAGIKLRNNHRWVTGAGNRTQALIVDIIEKTEPNMNENSISNFDHYYYPMVEFIDEDGKEVRQRLLSTVQPNQLDQYINIAYFKHENGEYEIVQDTKMMGSYLPSIAIGIGAFMLLVGIVRLVS